MIFKSTSHELGKIYRSGEIIFRQGDAGDCLFVILDGQVEILAGGEAPLLLDVLSKDEVFGVVSLFDGLPRPVCARARGAARVLTVDRKGFMQRLENDPGLTLRIMENVAKRTRRYLTELVTLKQALRQKTTGDTGIATTPEPGRGGDDFA